VTRRFVTFAVHGAAPGGLPNGGKPNRGAGESLPARFTGKP
jgi:hypothetical protein